MKNPSLLMTSLFTALLLSLSSVAADAAAPLSLEPVEEPADAFAGETLRYRIDFWLLRGSAEGELCFYKTSYGYRAFFEAETRGVLRVLGGNRRETMESEMEYDRAGQRLRPRLFRETFRQGKKTFSRSVAFDYERRVFTCTRVDPGGARRVTRAPLPDTDFEDLLSLYYNFRLGCYGPLRDDGRIRVAVVMKERPSFIAIEFPPPGSRERALGYAAAMTMDRDITHAYSRRVLARISPGRILESALIADAYFFGDLEVTLTGTGSN